MAVYGNFVSSNNRLSNMSYLIEEGNNIIKVLESINVLNENEIILNEGFSEVIKDKFQKFIEWLKKAKDTIIKFFKDLIDKILKVIKKKSYFDIKFEDDFKDIDYTYYKNKLQSIFKRIDKLFEFRFEEVDYDKMLDFKAECGKIQTHLSNIKNDISNNLLDKTYTGKLCIDYLNEILKSCKNSIETDSKYLDDVMRDLQKRFNDSIKLSSKYSAEQKENMLVLLALLSRVEKECVSTYLYLETYLKDSISKTIKYMNDRANGVKYTFEA